MPHRTKLEKRLLIVKIILWLLPVVLCVWIATSFFVFSGKLTVIIDPNNLPRIVREFATKEPDRLIGTKNKTGNIDFFQLITSSPLDFDIKIPQLFNKATVILKYQNPNNQPLIQLSSGNKFVDLARWQPDLEQMPDYWDSVRDGNTIIWQKNKPYFNEKKEKELVFMGQKKNLDAWREKQLQGVTDESSLQRIEDQYNSELDKITSERAVEKTGSPTYNSVSVFLDNLPNRNSIIAYNYDLNKYWEMPDYKKSSSLTVIDHPIRGNFELTTYLGDGESLNYTFTFQDNNQSEGADVYRVKVLDQDNKKIKEMTMADDGIFDTSGQIPDERNMQITVDNLPHGVYRFIISASNDLVTQNIKTFQHLIAFKGELQLAPGQSTAGTKIKPTVLHTTSSVIGARATQVSGFQTISIESSGKSSTILVDKLNETVHATELAGMSKIIVPRNNITISGNLYFSFDKNQLFDPASPVVAQLGAVKSIDDYDYIIANYPQPTKEGDWLVASASLDNPDSGQLLIYFPNLQESRRTIKVKEVVVTFEKEPVTLQTFPAWARKMVKKMISKYF